MVFWTNLIASSVSSQSVAFLSLRFMRNSTDLPRLAIWTVWPPRFRSKSRHCRTPYWGSFSSTLIAR
jgi:hypothetical protein